MPGVNPHHQCEPHDHDARREHDSQRKQDSHRATADGKWVALGIDWQWVMKQGAFFFMLMVFASWFGAYIVIPMRDDQREFMRSVIRATEVAAAANQANARANETNAEANKTSAATHQQLALTMDRLAGARADQQETLAQVIGYVREMEAKRSPPPP